MRSGVFGCAFFLQCFSTWYQIRYLIHVDLLRPAATGHLKRKLLRLVSHADVLTVLFRDDQLIEVLLRCEEAGSAVWPGRLLHVPASE